MAERREPYLVTVIRRLGDLEAMENPSPSETGQLNHYRLWLSENHPVVSAALACEYTAMRSRQP